MISYNELQEEIIMKKFATRLIEWGDCSFEDIDDEHKNILNLMIEKELVIEKASSIFREENAVYVCMTEKGLQWAKSWYPKEI